jgi:hypothetical protein
MNGLNQNINSEEKHGPRTSVRAVELKRLLEQEMDGYLVNGFRHPVIKEGMKEPN